MTDNPRKRLDTYAEEYGGTWWGEAEASREECSPKAFAALRAVLDLHRPHDALPTTCVECSEREDTYNDMPWPCPTVQAITSALAAS